MSKRGWRTAAFAALAVGAIALAGWDYLRFENPPRSTPIARATDPVPVLRSGDIISYTFVSGSIGWAVEGMVSPKSAGGPYWVFKTVDGAKHWRRQLASQSAWLIETIDDFEMLDADNGFLVAGDPLRLYRTVDGGAHWAALAQTFAAGQVTFSDRTHGWALGPGKLISTTDGGESWTQAQALPSDHVRVVFRGALEGWAGAHGAGNQPWVYSSQDGGRSWKKRLLPTPPGSQGNMYSTSVELIPGAGVAVTVSHENLTQLMTSLDGGILWTFTGVPTTAATETYSSYGYLDEYHWWAVVGNSLFKTSDAGQSWTQISDTIPAGLNLLGIVDSRAAWARFVYALGSGLMSTVDGGLHWTQANVPIPEPA